MGDGIFPSSRYFYDGTKLITDYSSDRRLDFLYDENDRLYGFVLNEVDTYFYVRDTLENILGIIDSTGKLVVKYTYNAWGKILSITGSKATTIGKYNPFRYKGYYCDDETGMYYCHTRYYVPEWCRWLSADSAAMINPYELFGENVYYYCYSDPINYYDPTGHSAILLGIIFGAIIGASIGFGVATYVDYKDDGEVFNGSVKWYDYAGATLAGGVIGGTLGGAIGYVAPAIGSFMGIGGGMSMSAGAMALTTAELSTVGMLSALAIGSTALLAEHTKNKRPSSRNKHEKGQTQRQRERRGGEKGDARRPYQKWKRGMAMILFLLWFNNDSL